MWRVTTPQFLARSIADPRRCDFPHRLHFEMVDFHITIDPVACDAYGYCAELLPEIVTLDEWGYPIVEARPANGALLISAKRAVRDCPKRAISLRERIDR
jgi:ferredoxin